MAWFSQFGRARICRSSARKLQLEQLEDRSLMAALAGAAALNDDSYEHNDTQAAAFNLGTPTATRTIGGLVMADAADWYRFTTTATGGVSDSVAINFVHAQGDLDLQLYNAAGQVLRNSNGITGSETISLSGLAAGTYYVKAYGYRGVTNPAYSLTINRAGVTSPPTTPTTPAPADDAYENNDTQAAASNLGTLTSSRTINNLAMADAHDWFTFTMNGPGTSANYVQVNFAHAQGDLDLELYNSAGTRVGRADGAGNSEQISLNGLAAGTYRIHVYGYQGVLNPSYSLQVSPGLVVTPPPTAPPTTPPATGGFDIQFNFSGLSAADQAIFQQAAARWEAVITGDLPNATYNGITVDDLLIDASSVAIDGTGGVLGQAGPDRFRSGSSLPYHGMMQFDSADMASMRANGTLLGVILHEMGHILGIGTLWSSRGLLSGSGGSNPIFTGPRATAEYNALFRTNASGVPVENTGGSGTRNSHWRETTFASEIMTGWVGPGGSLPMSRITIASLADMGYTVNMAVADAYVPPSSAVQSGGSGSGTRSSVLAGLIALPDLEELGTIQRRRWQSSVDALFAGGASSLGWL